MADAGLKLAVEGEKEFKSAINGINGDLKTLSTELKKSTSEFDESDKAQKSLKDQSRILGDQISKQTDKIGQMDLALKNAEASFGKNDKRTVEWRRKLNLAEAELNGMKKQLTNTDGKIVRFSDKLKRGAKAAGSFGLKIAGAAKKVGSFTAGKAISGLKGLSAGFMAAAASAGAMAVSSITAGAEIDKMSQQSHMSTQSYQEWGFVLGQFGLENEKVKDGMDSLIPKLAEARGGSEEAAAMFAKLGISQQELQTSSPEGLFQAVIMGLQGMSEGTEKAAIADELLGGAGSELAPILALDAEELRGMRKEAHDLGAVMDKDTIAAAKKSAQEFNKLKATLNGVKNEVSAEFLPSINLMLEGFNGLAAGQEGAEKKIADGIEGMLDKVKQGVEGAPAIVEKVFPALITMIVKNAPSLIVAVGKSAIEIVKIIGDTLIGAWPEIKEAGKDLIRGLWEGIKDMGAWIGEKIKGFTDGIVDSVKEFFGIHSPSTVFAGIGSYMAQGLGVGFEKQMDRTAKQMQAAVPLDYPAVAGGYPYMPGSAGGVEVSVYVGGQKMDAYTYDAYEREKDRRGAVQYKEVPYRNAQD